ncbi:MAG: hypothetical protein Roseis2KO_26600 [Roseivirga sp.]
MAKNQTTKDYWLLTDPQADIYNYLREPVTIEGRSKLVIFNHQQNTLLIYDIRNQELEKKIKYDFQGPNAINGVFPGGGLHVISKDSILIYSQRQATLYLSDFAGNIYKKKRIKNDSISFGALGAYSTLAYRNKKVYMQSLPATIGEFKTDYENRPNMFGSIDLNTGLTKEFVLDYPAPYQGKDQSQQLQMADIIYNPDADRFIISFPLSHLIYVTDFAGDTKTYTAKSKLVGKAVEIDLNRKDIDQNTIGSHYFWINDRYGKLVSDPVSGYYFREAMKGLSERNYEAREFNSEKEVIVLDKDFKQVTALPHHGGTFMYYFFGRNEIYWNKDFIEYNFERENEDTIYFESKRFN